MDTLSANTAGIDAAKGKTLEEMSDMVQQVSLRNLITQQDTYLTNRSGSYTVFITSFTMPKLTFNSEKVKIVLRVLVKTKCLFL